MAYGLSNGHVTDDIIIVPNTPTAFMHDGSIARSMTMTVICYCNKITGL